MKTIRVLQEHIRISDPHITSDNADRLSILGNTFEPLMRSGANGTFSPCLAESWTLSDDARTWTFNIRSDKRFQNGESLVADDVVFSLRRMRDEDIPGELGTSGVIRSYLAASEIDKTGSQVTLRTPEPMADLVDLLCEIPILSDTSVAALPDRYIGTGDFRIEEKDDAMLIQESENQRIVWNAEPDPEARLGAVREGEADIASGLSTHHADDNSLRIVGSPTSVCATFMFNFDTEAAQNVHLRRAVNLAVDVDALVKDVMHGAAVPLNGPLTSRHLGFDAGVQTWPYDPDAAMREIELGNCSGAEILIDIPSRLPDEAPLLGERVADYLRAVGLNPAIRIEEDRPEYAMRVRDRRIGTMACFDSSPGSTFRVFREKFHSGFAGPWWLGYSNIDFDALVDRAQKTQEPEARQVLYQKAYAILRNEAPWLFLYSPLRLTAVAPSLNDWSPSTGGLLLF